MKKAYISEYSKQEKKILIRYYDYQFHKKGEKDMTSILGARCTHGVVLVGDIKINLDEGAQYNSCRNS